MRKSATTLFKKMCLKCHLQIIVNIFRHSSNVLTQPVTSVEPDSGRASIVEACYGSEWCPAVVTCRLATADQSKENTPQYAIARMLLG